MKAYFKTFHTVLCIATNDPWGAFAKSKTDKNFTRIDWRAYHSTKVRLSTFIWCNGRATCGMPVNSGEIFISFPLGKCASWIICRNALHHMKVLEIGFRRS